MKSPSLIVVTILISAIAGLAYADPEKEGFYYRTAEHKSSFENTGVDVVEYVDMVCALRRAEQ